MAETSAGRAEYRAQRCRCRRRRRRCRRSANPSDKAGPLFSWRVPLTPHMLHYMPSPPAGYAGMTQGECESKGCCWAPAEFEGAPHVDLPWCFKANAGDSRYQADELDWGEGETGPESGRAAWPDSGWHEDR